MSNFKYTFYHISNKKKENKLEPIFKDFKNQIDIYHRQFDLTLKSYLKEWKSELNKNDKVYSDQKTKANIIYNKAFNETSEDEFAHSYAMHKSDLGIIEEQHYTEREEINNEYIDFLDLYSKSILIALYSLNESKLNQITNITSEIFRKKVKPSHFNSRDYLNSSILYIKLVLEINTDNLEKYISKLKEIQFLRNSLVHNASIFSDTKKAVKISKKYSNSLSFNPKTGFLKIISSDFIKDFFYLLKNFHEELFWLLDSNQNFIIIRNGLLHWLGILDNKISIDNLKFDKFSNKEKLLKFNVIPKDKDISKFECKITIKKSSKATFELSNQTENDKINDFLEYEKKIGGNYIKDIFKPFNITSEKHKIKLLVF